MKLGRDFEEVCEVVTEAIQMYKRNRRRYPLVQVIAEDLTKYSVNPSYIRDIFNNPEEKLREVDRKLVILFMEAFYRHEQIQGVEPSLYFTEPEIKEAKLYDGMEGRNVDLGLPYTFNRALPAGVDAYLATVTPSDIKNLMDGQDLHYDFETQREADFIKTHEGVRAVPKINSNNIAEMADLMVKGELMPSTLVWNAAVGTSDTGDELVYDVKSTSLTIQRGTIVNNLDGYHRCKATVRAFEIDPEFDKKHSFVFSVLVVNYSTKQAQKYLAQHAKAMPMSVTHVEMLDAVRRGDDIIKQLRNESDLAGRISTKENAMVSVDQLTTYKVLVEAIEKDFKLDSKMKTIKAGDYLVKFFTYLLGEFEDEFTNKYQETREYSFINHSSMFAGYIRLASKMYYEEISLDNLEKIINSIDFSKDSDNFKELNNEKNPESAKAQQICRDFFDKLDIEKSIGAIK
ncbi:hypothetical protein BEH_07660 [Priestia filamentosa]|uniref:Uncharacterized protein n=1 Tax=Priestia filamentosa TaxID=1402861 RepID=A0A0H4KGP9_9BACI|nr:DNA sulfur modification protein DndB [Priestia filamentosa]AKO91986.1 hypothetical protein BEH_07660 [Priestia filamentosa]